MRALLVLGLLMLASCRDPRTRVIDEPPPPPPPECGDGVIQEGEDCDASDLGTSTCQSQGFDMGRILCNATTCKYDLSLCVKRCGNGVLDLGEACDGTLGVMPCTTWGANLCTDTCTIDTGHCVSPAFENGPDMDISKGGPAVVGDFAPKGPGDLLMAVPAFTRSELVPWSMAQGFEASASRKLSFLRSPVRAEIIDVNGDSNLDVVTINADGTFDFMVFAGSTYSLQEVDAGCAGGRFLPTNGSVGRSVIVTGCGGYSVVSASGASKTTTAQSAAISRAGANEIWWADTTGAIHFEDGGTATLPMATSSIGSDDLDGDGDLDLATITSTGLEIFENTGAGFASRVTFTSSMPTELRVLDVDGDELPDLFWASGEEIIVRRNRGNFVFTETRVSAGTGARVSTSLGDVDGDRDLDVVVTVTTSGDATKTRVLINRTR